MYHARRIPLALPERSGHEEANAVNHAYIEARAAIRRDTDRLVGNKFRLGGHNGLSGARLRDAVERPCPIAFLLDVWQNRHLHKAPDKGGFSASDGSNYPDVNVSAGTLGDLFVNGMFRHLLYLRIVFKAIL
jgi:hypothetical protein